MVGIEHRRGVIWDHSGLALKSTRRPLVLAPVCGCFVFTFLGRQGDIGHHEIKTFNISLMRFMAEVSHHTLSDGGFLRMSNESSALLLDLPLGRFAQISDDQNDGIIECYCAFCYRLITASRDRHVLDMARQKHICAKASQAAMELIA